MTEMETQEFLMMLDTVAEVFDVELSDARKTAYLVALQDIPHEALRRACEEAIRTGKYFPVPGVLRDLAGYGMTPTDPAEAAWIRLRNLQTRYNREALEDPITKAVFEQMGGGYVLTWGFGNWALEKEDQKRREFISRYNEARNAQVIGTRRAAIHLLRDVNPEPSDEEDPS